MKHIIWEIWKDMSGLERAEFVKELCILWRPLISRAMKDNMIKENNETCPKKMTGENLIGA
jgi:hypothetical protein